MTERGRPTKLHPEIKDALYESISNGAVFRDAAEGAGVSYQTFLNWMDKGEKSRSGIFRDFFDSMRKAEAVARLRFTSTIAQAAAKGDWKAAMEFLKRRDRDNWGDNVDVTSGGNAITFRVVRDDGKDDSAAS